MIIGIAEQYHDYQPKMYFADTDLMNPDNPVDQAILSSEEDVPNTSRAHYDASNWEEIPFWQGHEKPGITPAAIRQQGPAFRLVFLTIQFE